MEKCPIVPSLRLTCSSRVFHLLSVRGRLKRRLEILPVRGLHPIHKPVSDQLIFPIPRFVAPPVGVADQSRRIQHQNHALRGIENLLVEVALALQLRLKRLLLRHIQHQPANLRDPPLCVAHRGNVLQRMQKCAILAPERLFIIPQHSALGQPLQKPLARRRCRIKMRAYVRAQHFLARCVAQHPHHGVVHIQKTPVRRRKKQAFLNTVETVPGTSAPLRAGP